MRKTISLLTVLLLLIFSVPQAIAVDIASVPVQDRITAGSFHSAWLTDSGVQAVGRSQSMDLLDPAWSDVIKVVGYHQLFGLRSDGTVIVTGEGSFTNDHFADWKNIVDIDVNECDVIGLQADGTVLMRGHNADAFMKFVQDVQDILYDAEAAVEEKLGKPLGFHIEYWEDMKDIAQGTYVSYGVRSNGTVDSIGLFGHCDIINCVSDWTDIVDVEAGQTFVAGLKSNGTVILGGGSSWAPMDTSHWRDIVAISAGSNHLVGLRADGTVVATGYNNHGQCDVEGLTNVVAVSAGFFHTLVLTGSGQYIGIGSNGNGQCNLN